MLAMLRLLADRLLAKNCSLESSNTKRCSSEVPRQVGPNALEVMQCHRMVHEEELDDGPACG
jgi:hypothetical protein